MHDLQATISNLIADLNPRQKTVLNKRFSLDGKSKKGITLAELGNKYGVTRERIRQIEEAAFTLVKKKIDQGVGKSLFDYIKSHLEGLGGVGREDTILHGVKSWLRVEMTPLQLHFLLEAAGTPHFHSEDENFHQFWYSNPKALATAKALIDKANKHLSQKKSEILTNRNFHQILPSLTADYGVSDITGLNYLSVSKKFGTNQYGDFGLAEWPEISPKTIRDRAYLVLKNLKKPVHFRDIATGIKEKRFDEKQVHASTVHNELIKDNRFVLVGRGIYGLSEHGFKPGTAREVIQRILKNSGPLTPDELVGLVLKERFFKPNTVLLNLQNKKLFKRISDGRYRVNEV